jgi:predicted DsbA family dithiol-disulfide isomerase
MQHFEIDIVSDVSCPWCIIGYQGLQGALEKVKDSISANITWYPFELNPNMPAEGQDITEHLGQKYGIDERQITQNRETIHERGLSVGYEFGHRGGGRIYNTFNAHRLLHFAETQQKQTALKLALFDLYFKHEGNPSDTKQLLQAAISVGLDKTQCENVLNSSLYETEVRQAQQYYQSMGISSVPAFIINKTHLVSGGQPADVFEKILKELAAKA